MFATRQTFADDDDALYRREKDGDSDSFGRQTSIDTRQPEPNRAGETERLRGRNRKKRLGLEKKVFSFHGGTCEEKGAVDVL